MLEILATTFGLIQGATVMMNKRCNWIFYIIQMILMAIFSWQNHLYGDTINSSIYVIFGLVGYGMWGSDGKLISISSKLDIAVYCVLIISGTYFIRAILISTNDPLPTLDAFTTISSFVATVLMVEHKLDTWVVWFINDIAYIVEYWLLPDQALYLLGLNIIWTIMAVSSFIIWRKKMLLGEKC